MTGWIAPREGGYHGGDGRPVPPPPQGRGAASGPPTPPSPEEAQAQLAESCARFLEVAAGVRAQALAAEFSPGAAEHMALATYASLVAHLGHA